MTLGAPYLDDGDVVLHLGDAVEVMAAMEPESVDAVVCDPPYALPGGFMSKPWDCHDGREDAGFAYWLAGLIDGEGHFAVKAHTRGSHAPCFTLKMRADEEGTLRLIQRTLGVGSLTREERGGHPMAKWAVQDKAGCQRLVDLLDKYPLRAKKRLDYGVWREAVCEWTERGRGNRWHGPADNTRMAELRGRLMAIRGYVEPAWSGHEFQDWTRLWAMEALRVLKPGAHALVFGGTRTSHRMTAGLEDAGFEIRDTVMFLHGSGFPKSLDVSKAIDKAAGAEREVIGKTARCVGPSQQEGYLGTGTFRGGTNDLTAPATPEAAAWQGWGTALKPAWEPVVVARKPLSGTVAANVLAHGTGALNVDGCRVGSESTLRPGLPMGFPGNGGPGYGTEGNGSTAGRWPPNVVLSHTPECREDGECHPECPVRRLDAEVGERTSGSRAAGDYRRPRAAGDYRRLGGHGRYGEWDEGPMPAINGDTGGPSRFFYTAKSSTAERDGATHPTIKPVALMRWLVRLVTPPGGLVLDCFAGSGTTGLACRSEGFRCVLIEREEEYAEMCAHRLRQLSLFGGA